MIPMKTPLDPPISVVITKKGRRRTQEYGFAVLITAKVAKKVPNTNNIDSL